MKAFEEYGENKWFFFTPKQRRPQDYSKPRFISTTGCWGDRTQTAVKHEGILVCSKQTLHFVEVMSGEWRKADWLMCECTSNNGSRKPDGTLEARVLMMRSLAEKKLSPYVPSGFWYARNPFQARRKLRATLTIQLMHQCNPGFVVGGATYFFICHGL